MLVFCGRCFNDSRIHPRGDHPLPMRPNIGTEGGPEPENSVRKTEAPRLCVKQDLPVVKGRNGVTLSLCCPLNLSLLS